MAKAKMGVIGAGWWATQFHIPSLKTYEKADLVGIADVKPEKAAAAADYYDIRNTYDDHRELLAAGVDGVVIAVQHAYHYEVARDALDAGVHVLIEKPMTLTAADAWDLVERAKSNGLHLMVGYTYQFTRHAQAALEIVQSGKIGDLQLVSGIFTSWVESYLRGKPQDYAEAFGFPVTGPEPDSYSDPKMAGGGQGHLQVTHPMGMALWVTDRRAVEVFAFMESYDLAVHLVDSFSYRLDNGASARWLPPAPCALTNSSTRDSCTRGAAASCARTWPGGGWRHSTTTARPSGSRTYPRRSCTRRTCRLVD